MRQEKIGEASISTQQEGVKKPYALKQVKTEVERKPKNQKVFGGD